MWSLNVLRESRKIAGTQSKATPPRTYLDQIRLGKGKGYAVKARLGPPGMHTSMHAGGVGGMMMMMMAFG